MASFLVLAFRVDVLKTGLDTVIYCSSETFIAIINCGKLDWSQRDISRCNCPREENLPWIPRAAYRFLRPHGDTGRNELARQPIRTRRVMH